MDTKCCCLLLRYQVNRHSHLALPEGATSQLHTLYAQVNKAIETKHLAQGYKHTGRSGARTHNFDGPVIMSPAPFRYTTRAPNNLN